MVDRALSLAVGSCSRSNWTGSSSDHSRSESFWTLRDRAMLGTPARTLPGVAGVRLLTGLDETGLIALAAVILLTITEFRSISKTIDRAAAAIYRLPRESQVSDQYQGETRFIFVTGGCWLSAKGSLRLRSVVSSFLAGSGSRSRSSIRTLEPRPGN